jgi:hypothetical protein
MSKFIPRQLAPIIKAQQTKFPVLAITGPRQYGGLEDEKRTKYNVLGWKNISD